MTAGVRPMTGADVAQVRAVGVDAGERFRSFPEPRIAACAEHEPWRAEDLAPYVDDGRAWVATTSTVPSAMFWIDIGTGP